MDLLDQITRLELKAEAFGFCWDNTSQIIQQIASELDEVQAHLGLDSIEQRAALQEEMGDLLHAVFSLCVFCKLEPVRTLQGALKKFERRLTRVIERAYEQGMTHVHQLSFDQKMKLWDQAKHDLLSDVRTNQQPCLSFEIDERLLSSSYVITEWPLSTVLLKNNAHFPWFILVPRRLGAVEIIDMDKLDQYQWLDEVACLSSIVKTQFHPDKLNVGALGNIVTQLHTHVVARFHHDKMWPYSIWQADCPDLPYDSIPSELILTLQQRLALAFT